MKKKPIIIGCSIALCLGLLVVIAVLVFAHWFAESVFNADPEDCTRSVSTPLSLSAAQQEIDFRLPQGATNILFAEYSQWIAYDFMLKFDAPLDVCKSHAIALLQQHNTNMPERLVPIELRPIDAPPEPVPVEPPLNVTWFDIHNITNGFVGGEFGSHQPMIWIDADRGILYYRYTD